VFFCIPDSCQAFYVWIFGTNGEMCQECSVSDRIKRKNVVEIDSCYARDLTVITYSRNDVTKFMGFAELSITSLQAE